MNSLWNKVESRTRNYIFKVFRNRFKSEKAHKNVLKTKYALYGTKLKVKLIVKVNIFSSDLHP